MASELVAMDPTTLGNGDFYKQLEAAILEVFADIKQRPAVEMARKVTVKLTFSPDRRFEEKTRILMPPEDVSATYEIKVVVPSKPARTVPVKILDGKPVVNVFDADGNPDQLHFGNVYALDGAK